MKWQTRCFIRSFLPLLPFQSTLRSVKRKLSPFNFANASDILNFTLIMLRALQAKENFFFKEKSAMELGTGWEPLVPLLLRAAGFKKVITVDLQRLLDIHSCRTISRFLRQHSQLITEQLSLNGSACDAYLHSLSFSTLKDFLTSAGIEYIAPCDARNLPLPDHSIDLIISNNVLEHIPKDIITAILSDFHRVLHPDGKMTLTIDNHDHWAYTDPSISRANFLRYEDSFWDRTGANPIDYQNRMRHFEYLELLSDCGFTIAADLSEVDEKLLADCKAVPLCSRYRNVSHDKLAIGLSRIIAEKEPE